MFMSNIDHPKRVLGRVIMEWDCPLCNMPYTVELKKGEFIPPTVIKCCGFCKEKFEVYF